MCTNISIKILFCRYDDTFVSTNCVFNDKLNVERKEIKVHEQTRHKSVDQNASGGRGVHHDKGHFQRSSNQHIRHLIGSGSTDDQGYQDGEQHQLNFNGEHVVGYIKNIFFLRVKSYF